MITRVGAAVWDFEFDPWVGDIVKDLSGDSIRVEGLHWGKPSNGHGFEVTDGSDDPPYVTDTHVEQSFLYPKTRKARIRLVLSREPRGYDWRVHHALRQEYGVPNGPISGGRTCFRDEAEWVSDRDISGNVSESGFVARNWINRFSLPLPK